MLRNGLLGLTALVAALPSPVASPARASNLNDLIHEVCSTNQFQIDNQRCVGLLNTNYRDRFTESEMGNAALWCRFLEDRGILGSEYHFDDVVDCQQTIQEGRRGPGDNRKF
jgi:hypothetical protein